MQLRPLHASAIFMLFIFQGCAPMNQDIDISLQNQRNALTAQKSNTGFNAAEAKQLLEFCIELNNQDDRNKPENQGNPEYEAQLGTWKPVFDSRSGTDPTTNGIKPFNNAWLLLQNQQQANQYAIAIRGTVGQKDSIIDDALASTIAASAGIKFPENTVLPIQFAVTPRSEVHLGFAYGAFTLLFHKELGILKQLQQLPNGSRLYITGHSQGAAIATLLHAFLHYAITDPNDRYGLQSKNLTLKSYVYAQPKPGNYQFALDFARIAGSHGAAFVINNNLDPVPRVPLSKETVGESLIDTLDENQSLTRGPAELAVDGLTYTTQAVFWVRNLFSHRIEDKVPQLYQKQSDSIDTHYFANIAEIPEPSANSLNYTLSGTSVPVFGYIKGGTLYPLNGNQPDWLLQHHATTYRKLIAEQFK